MTAAAQGHDHASSGVLYAVACAAPPVLEIRPLIAAAQHRGFDVCLVLTPTAAAWLASDLGDLEALTGHPVRSAYKLPGEADVLPPPDAIVVAPCTSNTLNKWGSGHSDTLALGLITEAIGKRLPLVALPCLNSLQAAHPAYARHVADLRAAGVTILDPVLAHQPGEFPWQLALAALDRSGRERDG
ncbi:MAG TPA: flavoprotein [Streptosporangiaceae bacterium]|jgi:hypothetical protein